MIVAASTLPTAELLTDFVWVFAVGTVVVAILHRWRFPSLLGFLLTGLIVGPAGLALVTNRDAIDIMAEIGIVLLMFTIGLEVSLAELGKMAGRVVGGGSLQIGLTTAAVAGIGILSGLPTMTAVALGLIVSASSTALVLRLLGDRGELRTPSGQMSLAILLMQDFAVVLLMLVLPMLAAGDLSPWKLGTAMLRAGAIAAGIIVVARFAFPWLLARVVDLRSREVFLLTSVLAVFGTAWVADAAGLSLALGAFLAGLVISESEFSHQMSAEVLPFRDVLNGLFFVSVGLLVERAVILENLAILPLLIVGALLLKAVIVTGASLALRLPWRSALIAGVALSQVGEFALVLAQQAASLEMLSAEQHGLLITVSVVTMILTPLMIPFATERLSRAADIEIDDSVDGRELENHVIIVGYGLNGRNVSRALSKLHVPFVIVETNRNTVIAARSEGAHIVYGDATTPALLHHLHIEKARALVSCIADPAATRDIVSGARHANQSLLIIARTRYVSEIEPLQEIGANSVVPEEFETSMELTARVMRAYGASESAIASEKRALRDQHYNALLNVGPEGPHMDELSHILEHVDVAQVRVDAGAHGKTLEGLDLRRATGATAIVVLRGPEHIDSPDPQFELRRGDRVVLVGDPAALDTARQLLEG